MNLQDKCDHGMSSFASLPVEKDDKTFNFWGSNMGRLKQFCRLIHFCKKKLEVFIS